MPHHHPPSPKERGFSLVELLTVVGIIGIIAALAIPNYLSSKQAARSASAINSLRVIHSCETSFHSTRGHYADLAALGAAGLVTDPLLRGGSKEGYDFALSLSANNSRFEVRATPLFAPSLSKHFFVDNSGVIRTEAGAPAAAGSTPIN